MDDLASLTTKPAQDSFGNLLNFGAGKGLSNLTLRERQDQLEAEKRRKEEERRKQAQAHYGDAAESDDDLFAAFNASTKVDNSSHYPPPAPSTNPSPANAPSLDLGNPKSWNKSAAVSAPSGGAGFDDDDDPFGLNKFQTKARAPAPPRH
ncbi:auxilin-like clathrin-binding protein required for normal clathrin function [Collariella sp. IMI 366227]|nr:auxilin-like clathrin-binding protein required for normal clathrin function [Collariella sp. IMI 366227]